MRGLATAFACLLVGGCALYETEGGTIDDTSSVPLRGEWRVALDATMALEGPGAIERIRVGGQDHEGNFANRGDIVVDTWSEPRIRVQMRPFTRSADNLIAQEELERFELWAFATEGAAPQRPEDMLVPRPCVNDDGSLRDGCAIRVLYDGQLQPTRAGVDLWVTVPEQWEGFLELYTEDNDHDGDYLNRGNVCVTDLRAEVSVDLESGIGLARLARGADVSFRGNAANITMDVPADLTSRLFSTISPRPAVDLHCDANYDVDNPVFEDVAAGETHIATAGPLPHALAPEVSATAIAFDCAEQINAESPEAYLGPDDLGEPELHGNVHFCHGCLSAPCSQMLPGFE